MTRIRRTKAEIEGGLTHAQKLAGMDLEELVPQQAETPKNGSPPPMRTLRTKKQMVAAKTAEEVDKAGVSLTDYQSVKILKNDEDRQKGIVKSGRSKPTKADQEKQRADLRTWLLNPLKKATESPYKFDKEVVTDEGNLIIYRTKTVEKEVIVELPVVKEVRVLFANEGSSLTVGEIIQRELVHPSNQEWLRLDMDKKLSVEKLNALGKKGWQFKYIMDWSHIGSGLLKDKPKSMFFCRPLKKAKA